MALGLVSTLPAVELRPSAGFLNYPRQVAWWPLILRRAGKRTKQGFIRQKELLSRAQLFSRLPKKLTKFQTLQQLKD